jgi:hypothetical protein
LKPAAEVVQAQLDAYNAQDLDAFCACFDDACIIENLHGDRIATGLAGVRERYRKLFADHPDNHARLVNRIVVGPVVIDHEAIDRGNGERYEAIAIYTVKNGRIVHVDFVR